MENITNIRDYTVTGIFEVDGSVKPDKDSTVSKRFVLRVKCIATPLQDIMTKALSTVKISWTNGPGRGKFATLKDRDIIEIDFGSPAKKVETREEKIAKYVAMGYNLEVATFAVDKPAEFAELVNKSINI